VVCFFRRDTMLQALRFVIQGAGSKVDAAIRKNLVSLLLSMLGHDEVRLSASGCTADSAASRLGWFSPWCVGDWISCRLGGGSP
jgi:hypothetical protein